MDIIRATIETAEDLGYVHATAWNHAYRGIVPDEYLNKYFIPEKRAEKFRKVLPSTDNEYYIAYFDGKPMGMVVLGKSGDDDAKENAGEVSAIYLLSGYWGKGYGKKLMDFAVNRLKEFGCSTVTLWVLEENKRARTFYEKYGYVFDGTKKELNLGKPLVEMRYVYSIT